MLVFGNRLGSHPQSSPQSDLAQGDAASRGRKREEGLREVRQLERWPAREVLVESKEVQLQAGMGAPYQAVHGRLTPAGGHGAAESGH
ncbi:hypothetical protein SBBP2_1110002 [Burkholderiales bacterium]|nr:hypothetical protein SBBP2_1110002 [Burkholderiales bacterium]